MATKPRRQGLTRTGATPLLRTVAGRPHAREEDHDDIQEPQEDVNAEPIDPDDLKLPPVKASKTTLESLTPDSNQDNLRKPSSRKRKAESPRQDPEPELRKPGPTKRKRSTTPIVPRRGQFEQTQAAKASSEGNKENSRSTQTPPSSSGNIWSERFGLFSSQASQSGSKKTYGGGTKTKNLHVAPPTQGKKSTQYGTKAKTVKPPQDDVDSDFSMADDEELDRIAAELAAEKDAEERRKKAMAELGLRNVPTKKKPAHADSTSTDSSALDETTLQEHLGLTGTQDGSLPPSSAPQEEIDHIHSYVHNLPAEPEEGTACPLCNEPVSQESYWTFWKSVPKTIKNQSAFCHSHKRTTATQDYLSEGYPSLNNTPHIDWPALPDRIKKHRMALYSILANTAPSKHRTRYAPLALTGKAAAIPTSRPDLPAQTRAHLSAYALDSNAVFPGYYGPRGRRLISESVMALLAAEIKRSADPVVLTSGPATFVQAVLVPEVAVRLIMEDLQCDAETAEEVREATFEMGGLLNEEVEDCVEVGEVEGEEDLGREYCEEE